jgi:hypothetical protein
LSYVGSHFPFLPNHQMVNTRNSQCNGQPSSNNNNNNNSNNNVNLEQLITTQNQLMQAVLQTLNNIKPNQQAHQQQAPPPPPPHQSHLAEFLQTRPTTFSQAKDPMEAEDWPKGVEKCHTPVLKSTEPKPPYMCPGCSITRIATI